MGNPKDPKRNPSGPLPEFRSSGSAPSVRRPERPAGPLSKIAADLEAAHRKDAQSFPSGPLPALSSVVRPDDELSAIIPWRLGKAAEGESCRWVCVDSRWVSVSLGDGTEMGSVVVMSSSGQREVVQSYEGALAVAKSWRTW